MITLRELIDNAEKRAFSTFSKNVRQEVPRTLALMLNEIGKKSVTFIPGTMDLVSGTFKLNRIIKGRTCSARTTFIFEDFETLKIHPGLESWLDRPAVDLKRMESRVSDSICTWTYNLEDYTSHETGCGEEFYFTDPGNTGTPFIFAFCPFCGARTLEVNEEEEEL